MTLKHIIGVVLFLEFAFRSNVAGQTPAPTQSGVIFTALALGNKPVTGWVYFDGKKEVPFKAFNYNRSVPYRYSGAPSLQFFLPGMSLANPPQPVASAILPENAKQVFLLFVPKADKTFDILALNGDVLGEIEGGYFFINLLKEQIRIGIGSEKFSIPAKGTALKPSPVKEGDSFPIVMSRNVTSTKVNPTFFSTVWAAQADSASIVILVESQGKPQVFVFSESPSQRRALLQSIENESQSAGL